MSAPPLTMLHRVLVTPDQAADLAAHLEASEDYCWLTRQIRCRRHTLRGVPGRLVTVDWSETPPGDRQGWCLEIARKRGRYDGQERDSLTLRPWRLAQTHYEVGSERGAATRPVLTCTHLSVGDADPAALSLVVLWDGGGWERSWPRLRSSLDGYDLPAIVAWHWSRYYQHLEYSEMRALADAWEAMHPDLRRLTLAEANRLASRDLYALSRQLGWRKLTAREMLAHGLDRMWVREEEVLRPGDPSAPRDGTQTGCGQYTQQAASGRVPMRGASLGPGWGVCMICRAPYAAEDGPCCLDG